VNEKETEVVNEGRTRKEVETRKRNWKGKVKKS
jgi:hypothetical protein